ncbi:MAG TPA: SCP2 sterol-binding domain-containing protein [Deltaproteobacteria bacterium]|nr:SCP2 sterol-binding domain-containing protein [Deltaproteobacteria bacterium]
MSTKEEFTDRIFKLIQPSLRVLPRWLEAIGAGVIISTVVEENPELKEELKELGGRVFLFEARDIEKRFYLIIEEEGQIKVLPHWPSPPDVTMRGDIKTLFDLFTGREDADTVFFSRKLEISGDTASAVHLKNILASIY